VSTFIPRSATRDCGSERMPTRSSVWFSCSAHAACGVVALAVESVVDILRKTPFQADGRARSAMAGKSPWSCRVI
jgi:hypothetical protein